VEFLELPRSVHPYLVATQAHPEFLSRPTRPHPLFTRLVAAAMEHARSVTASGVSRRAAASA
jgi:CTP synthase